MYTQLLLAIQVREQHHMMDGWVSGWPFMILLWITLIALIVTLIWFLVKKAGDSDKRTHDKSARQIIDERFARGEIDSEEYRQMKNELDSR